MTYDLETVAAKLEIGELETRYTWAIDEGRVELLAEVFAEDGRMSMSPGDVDRSGRESVLEWYGEYCDGWGWKNRRHYLANLQIDVAGNTARGRAYFLLTHEAHERSRVAWGNYDDRYEKRDGRWWIVEKRITSTKPVTLEKGWAGSVLPPSPADWR